MDIWRIGRRKEASWEDEEEKKRMKRGRGSFKNRRELWGYAAGWLSCLLEAAAVVVAGAPRAKRRQVWFVSFAPSFELPPGCLFCSDDWMDVLTLPCLFDAFVLSLRPASRQSPLRVSAPQTATAPFDTSRSIATTSAAFASASASPTQEGPIQRKTSVHALQVRAGNVCTTIAFGVSVDTTDSRIWRALETIQKTAH